MRVAVLTISDAGSRGDRADTSGDAIREWIGVHGWALVERPIVPDEAAQISDALRAWADADAADLVVTTGGTGLSPRDVTPEATEMVLEREAPGIPEAMRMAAAAKFPRAALSRGVAGTRKRTLIVNRPGSPAACATGSRCSRRSPSTRSA